MTALEEKYPGAVSFKFGDNEQLCEELIELVRAGKKRATCGEAAGFGPGKEAPPVVGRRDIALHWDGRPALVIETVDVSFNRFCDVTEDFALAEGENPSLADWQREHQAYFERNGGWSEDMLLLCERFELVEDLGG